MGGKIGNTLENEKNTCAGITGLFSKFGFHVSGIQKTLQIFAEFLLSTIVHKTTSTMFSARFNVNPLTPSPL